ncbi:MAG: lysostaphin resistance A-like protein [Planctomycetota bacterium]
MSQLPRSLLQVGLAFVLAVLLGADWRVGCLMAVTCVMVFPPAPWRPIGWPRVLASYGVWLLLWVAFAAAYLRVMVALGHRVEPQPQLLELATHGAGLPAFWLHVLVIVGVAPLVEEIIFRGYLFAAVENTLPKWGAHLLVASLFGLAHGLDHALPIAVLALVFGYLRQRQGSLLPSICAHALHNGLTVAAIVCWPGLLDLLYAR